MNEFLLVYLTFSKLLEDFVDSIYLVVSRVPLYEKDIWNWALKAFKGRLRWMTSRINVQSQNFVVLLMRSIVKRKIPCNVLTFLYLSFIHNGSASVCLWHFSLVMSLLFYGTFSMFIPVLSVLYWHYFQTSNKGP